MTPIMAKQIAIIRDAVAPEKPPNGRMVTLAAPATAGCLACST
jgi:hypothetical protein